MRDACILRWLLVASVALGGCASNGVIRGTLRLPHDPSAAHTAQGDHAAPGQRTAQDAVIYLEQVPPKIDAALTQTDSTPTIGQTKHCFIPNVLPVAAGSTVRFENRDRVYHNVFSVSPIKRFDVGKYAPGKSKAVRFDKQGVVQLFCDIDPSMAGYVMVLPHHAFVQPDVTGAFALPKLPRGTYTVKVWHPKYGRLTRKVEMPKRGDAIVELRY